MRAPRCDACAHWDKNEADDWEATKLGAHECLRVIPLWLATDFNRETGRSEPTKEAAETGMFANDASSWRAELFTKPDFFCAHFTPMPPS